jgi:hypothetical protein
MKTVSSFSTEIVYLIAFSDEYITLIDDVATKQTSTSPSYQTLVYCKNEQSPY